ncbi:MAG: SpoIID/LytB domain-containing protein [Nitrospirae bacterium]|nr:SpoIID/LytB domain-containing protein [Nitrospirota bacterium]
MKRLIYLIIFASLFLLCRISLAEDNIRVLMLDDPDSPLPSEKTERLGKLNGKIFFKGEAYTGSLEVRRDEKGLYIIDDLPFEKYIKGVVASETGGGWEMEALKAQAVISRTYALFYKNLNKDKEYDLTSSVLHQVFKEDNINPQITRAVEGTWGEILMYEGNPAKTLYHSICIGKTELPEEVWGGSYPYLKSVDCNSKNTPYDNWMREFTFDEIGKAVGIKGNVKDITIASYTSTGRVKTLKITTGTAETELEIRATDLRKYLGYKILPSTDFSLTKEAEIMPTGQAGVTFEGRGWGHGVGLCQWGALEMAREGKNYKEILAHYYPGTNIGKQAVGD